MSRIRYIKPGFFKNEDLCLLSFAHRLCFEGLWVEADREGRLEDRPKRLKAEIFPYDDVDMEELVAGLAAAGFILRYEVAAVRYIAIPPESWKRHQRPRRDEMLSVFPPPPDRTDASLRRNESAAATSPQGSATDADPCLDSDEFNAVTHRNPTPNAAVTDQSLRSDGPDAAQCVGKGNGNGNGNGEMGEDAHPHADRASVLPYNRPRRSMSPGLLRAPRPGYYRDAPGRFAVPDAWHNSRVEELEARGYTRTAALGELDPFYDRWIVAYTKGGDRQDTAVEKNNFAFWDARHAETWPVAVSGHGGEPRGAVVRSAADTRADLDRQLGEVAHGA